ncbi:unnamed protein product [Effrenium voratum]|uniref:Transmembrane protein n=1 Tax=Effrenium voratum TaxID=2562239 RepID=A0AA36JRD7_9DINO|nr:unnamed protein product [Effrenium voratum]
MTSDVEQVYCTTDSVVFVGCFCIMCGVSLFLILLPYALRFHVEIEDISLDRADGVCHVVVRTHGKHWLTHRSLQSSIHNSLSRLRRGRVSKTGSLTINGHVHVSKSGRILPAIFTGTEHPFLDAPSLQGAEEGWVMTEAAAIEAEASALYYYWAANPMERTPSITAKAGHLIQPVSPYHLLLFSPDGMPNTRAIETSKGIIRIPFPLTLFAASVPGTVVSLGWLLVFAGVLAFLPFIVMITSPEGAKWVYLVSALIAALIAVLFHGTAASRRELSPMQRKLRRHCKNLLRTNPAPIRTPKGPERAIKAGHLVDVADAFNDRIRHRDMYYVATNIIKPVTRTHRLSYAECVGPQMVDWFVSHYWGTSFRHFVSTLQKHSEAVVEPPATPPDVAYWICSFSNNQWQIEEELGAGWEESSFFLALKSPRCVGTAMILDDEALPLTRAWCLFEVLQTKIIRTTRENFRGLYLCTITGVLQNGKSGVDLPMRIAERLASLRLENATASVQKDKEMIGELVSKMPGGFQAMNHFLRRNISEALRTMQAVFTSELETLLHKLDNAELESEQDSEDNIVLCVDEYNSQRGFAAVPSEHSVPIS